MNCEFSKQLGSAENEEDHFDQLNNETFGELSNADDWECEHEKLTESVVPKATLKPQKVANNIQHSSHDTQEPLQFFNFPNTELNSLKAPARFTAPPIISRHSHNNHFFEDEAELALHESDLVKQLSRLVMENEEEEERFNNTSHNHHLNHQDSSLLSRNGLQPPESFRLFSSPSNTKLHNPLEELLHLNTSLSRTTTPLPSSGMKCKMTLEELEIFLLNNDKIKVPLEEQKRSQQNTPWKQQQLSTSFLFQQPPPSPFQHPPPPLSSQHPLQPPPPNLPPPMGSQLTSPQLSKENILQTQQQQNLHPMQHHLNSQRLHLQHQQQQLLMQLQQVQQQAIQIQQRLVMNNKPPLSIAHQQQQITLRQQQQQLIKLQHFLQQNLQQMHHHNLMLQQQSLPYSQQQQLQQQLPEITNTDNLQKQQQQQHPQQIIQFPQHQQQIFQQQQMMLLQQQMGLFPMMTPPQHMQQQQHLQRQQRPPDHPFYNGLMEQREKDWLIKIQLLQLHTDNPLIDDYYYTCWSMKKLIRENKILKKDVDKNRRRAEEDEKRMNEEEGGDDGDAKGVKNSDDDDGEEDSHDDDDDDDDDNDEGGRVAKLLISTDEHGEGREYVPVQFEGSLGKLRATSIYNPRKVLEVHVSANADDPKKQVDKRLKEVLYKIEKGFDTLLQADELHNKISKVDMDMRDDLEIKRHDLIERLTTELLSNDCHVMQQVINIRKGVVMVTRWMSLLSKEEEKRKVVDKLLIKLNSLVKKEWCHEIASRLFKAISVMMNRSTDITDLLHYSICITKNAKTNNIDKFIASLLKNQLSCSCVVLMAVQCECLMAQKTDKNNNFSTSDQKRWRDFIEVVGRGLSTREETVTLFKTTANSTASFRAHLSRFLETDVVNAACNNLFCLNDSILSS